MYFPEYIHCGIGRNEANQDVDCLRHGLDYFSSNVYVGITGLIKKVLRRLREPVSNTVATSHRKESFQDSFHDRPFRHFEDVLVLLK